jgi:hypothetical protein
MGNISQIKKEAIAKELKAKKLSYAKIADKYDVDTDTVRGIAKIVVDAVNQKRRQERQRQETYETEFKVNEAAEIRKHLSVIERLARRLLTTILISSTATAALITGVFLWLLTN